MLLMFLTTSILLPCWIFDTGDFCTFNACGWSWIILCFSKLIESKNSRWQDPHLKICFFGEGENCGEGKTWFQKYVQSLLGRRRVVAGGINIHSNSASIAHALSKRPLATTDIFLFNIGKARNREQEVNYSFIEDLKDGNVFASKYDSKELMIKVPNIVMVFSNSTPDVEELARDRWEIFSIENDELVKRQISKSCPPVVLTSNKNQSNELKKKKCPQDSDNDSECWSNSTMKRKMNPKWNSNFVF